LRLRSVQSVQALSLCLSPVSSAAACVYPGAWICGNDVVYWAAASANHVRSMERIHGSSSSRSIGRMKMPSSDACRLMSIDSTAD